MAAKKKRYARKPIHKIFPVGSRVILIESGATGVVVRHVRASTDDRPATKAHKVRWDTSKTESYVRPGRLLQIVKDSTPRTRRTKDEMLEVAQEIMQRVLEDNKQSRRVRENTIKSIREWLEDYPSIGRPRPSKEIFIQ